MGIWIILLHTQCIAANRMGKSLIVSPGIFKQFRNGQMKTALLRGRLSPTGHDLENQFERLKNRLLAEQLETVELPQLNAPLRRAANEAAALAWVTFFPLLVFPALFEEKTNEAVRQVERQARIFANSSEIVAA